jgi:uncharacterized membrane protein
MTSRKLTIVLFVSLACNLFLVGAVVGGLVVGARFRAAPMMEGRSAAPVLRAADSLTPEQRRAYRQALRGEAMPMAGALREARLARQDAWRGLMREPFDEAQTIADLDRARAREMEARGAVERRVVHFAGTLSPEERVRFAEGLMRAGPRGGRHPGRTPGAPDPTQ